MASATQEESRDKAASSSTPVKQLRIADVIDSGSNESRDDDEAQDDLEGDVEALQLEDDDSPVAKPTNAAAAAAKT